ncbi:MAG: hypothetical protein QOK21_2753 [Solirubrobacteraceae bacterium]|jgi:hypothetical protein|nr:hypothetical protein [Solirubrobacteraceae bacterium]
MPGVSQISLPLRIVLGVAVAFVALYMVALRPKSAATPAPAPAAPAGNVNTGAPAQTGFGKAVESAKSAAAATDAASAKSDAASAAAGTDSTGTRTAAGSAAHTANGSTTPPATAGSAKATGLPLPVLKAVAHHKVLALLFWNPQSPDDRLVHAALKKVDRFDGAVFVHAAPISNVSRYARITRGADVEQAPTLVIVDRKLRSTNLVGYVDALAVNQAVVDALRASGGLTKSAYLKRVNGACSSVVRDMVAMPQATTVGKAPRALGSRIERFGGFVRRLRATPAPSRLRGFHKTLVADATAMQSVHRSQVRALGTHPSLANVSNVLHSFDSRKAALGKPFERHAAKQNLKSCR